MTPAELVTVEIDGDAFTVGPLTFETATDQLPVIMGLIGPALADLAAAGAGADISSVKVEALLPIIPRLFGGIGGGKLVALLRLFLGNATINGKLLVPVWNVQLMGRMDVALELFGRALWLNYHRVFTRLLASALKAKGEHNASPST